MNKRMHHPEQSRETRLGLDHPDSILRQAMCSGKDGLTWAQARAILDRLPRKGRRTTAYHCPVCRAWHIGSPLRKKRAWRKL